MSVNTKAFWVLLHLPCLLSNNRANQQMHRADDGFLAIPGSSGTPDALFLQAVWRDGRTRALPSFPCSLKG